MEDRVELKVVLHLLRERAFIAVQGKDTDPVVEPVQAGTLEEALAAIPGLVERARERWATSPRNPKYEGPPPPPPPPVPSPQPFSRRGAAARPAPAGDEQWQMF